MPNDAIAIQYSSSNYNCAQNSELTRLHSLKKEKTASLTEFIEKAVEESWPKELNNPLLCYFDDRQGPIQSRILKYEFDIDEKIKQRFIEKSMDSVLEQNSFSMVSYKNEYLLSVTSSVKNVNETRGGETLISIITKTEKNFIDAEGTEQHIREFALAIFPKIEEHLSKGGTL